MFTLVVLPVGGQERCGVEIAERFLRQSQPVLLRHIRVFEILGYAVAVLQDSYVISAVVQYHPVQRRLEGQDVVVFLGEQERRQGSRHPAVAERMDADESVVKSAGCLYSILVESALVQAIANTTRRRASDRF